LHLRPKRSQMSSPENASYVLLMLRFAAIFPVGVSQPVTHL
jgi:hypothetical protein